MATIGRVVLKEWNAEAIKGMADREVSKALNETADESVALAAEFAPKDTGYMASTMEVVERATPKKLNVIWGNISANYTLWQEIGSQGRPGRYFMRRASQQAYANLAERLRNKVS